MSETTETFVVTSLPENTEAPVQEKTTLKQKLLKNKKYLYVAGAATTAALAVMYLKSKKNHAQEDDSYEAEMTETEMLEALNSADTKSNES